MFEDDTLLFSEEWVSIRFLSEEAAAWFADFFGRASSACVLHLPPGHGEDESHKTVWCGDLNDDCHTTISGVQAHVEHMNGPLGKGGFWHCEVAGQFHLSEHPGIQLRSSAAGRWLCELLVAAYQAGVAGHIR